MPAFIKTEKIRFRHCDNAGIVFYPRFLEMWNDLVEDWFSEELALPFEKLHATHGIPTVQLQVQFQKPARLGEMLTRKLWVNRLGNSSLDVGMHFYNEAGETYLEGIVTLVFVHLGNEKDALKSEKFPDTLKEKMQLFMLDPA